VCMSRLANTWWFLGRHSAAIRARDAAMAWADQTGHPATRSAAVVFAALLCIELRDSAGLRAYSASLQESDGTHDSKMNSMAAETLAAYVDVLDGRPEPGMARIQRQLDAVQTFDPAPGGRAAYRRILLAACAAAGDAKSGLATADRSLAFGDGVTTWESETRRLRAEFLATLGAPPAEIAAELDRALVVARRQHARLFELRATTSMLRLAYGDAAEVRDRLAQMVAEMGDARGTPDWQDAVDLLGSDPAAERHGKRPRNAPSPNL
jgi:hypothetical protein